MHHTLDKCKKQQLRDIFGICCTVPRGNELIILYRYIYIISLALDSLMSYIDNFHYCLLFAIPPPRFLGQGGGGGRFRFQGSGVETTLVTLLTTKHSDDGLHFF